MNFYQRIVRPGLFRFDAERMHDASIRALRCLGGTPVLRPWCRRHYQVRDERLRSEVFGLQFENPIGLAAGYDKNGLAIRGLEALGFGFLEIGSISIDPSPGNPRPRLFRLPQHRVIIVHYGLPNIGAHAVVQHLGRSKRQVPLGVNLVNTNRLRSDTEQVILDDFVRAFRAVRNSADYIVLNLSCPNTESGRECFAERRRVAHLLELLSSEGVELPLLLKVSPLGGVAAIDSLLEVVDPFHFVSGFIFNTPSGKPDALGLSPEQLLAMPGAVTGPVHEPRMNEAIGNLYGRMDRDRYRIVGVGGVFSAEDAYRKIRLGASLVQIYTALVYQGPGIVRKINQGLANLLKRDGLSSVAAAVGVDATAR
jgi:dihydroorotate dehydrogenase (fumarate)/dihydroorotate dehydrogenase